MEKFLNLGSQPLANSYIKKSNLKLKEKKFKLQVGFNKKNYLVSIIILFQRRKCLTMNILTNHQNLKP